MVYVQCYVIRLQGTMKNMSRHIEDAMLSRRLDVMKSSRAIVGVCME
jgi:hypothetical protein